MPSQGEKTLWFRQFCLEHLDVDPADKGAFFFNKVWSKMMISDTNDAELLADVSEMNATFAVVAALCASLVFQEIKWTEEYLNVDSLAMRWGIADELAEAAIVWYAISALTSFALIVFSSRVFLMCKMVQQGKGKLLLLRMGGHVVVDIPFVSFWILIVSLMMGYACKAATELPVSSGSCVLSFVLAAFIVTTYFTRSIDLSLKGVVKLSLKQYEVGRAKFEDDNVLPSGTTGAIAYGMARDTTTTTTTAAATAAQGGEEKEEEIKRVELPDPDEIAALIADYHPPVEPARTRQHEAPEPIPNLPKIAKVDLPAPHEIENLIKDYGKDYVEQEPVDQSDALRGFTFTPHFDDKFGQGDPNLLENDAVLRPSVQQQQQSDYAPPARPMNPDSFMDSLVYKPPPQQQQQEEEDGGRDTSFLSSSAAPAQQQALPNQLQHEDDDNKPEHFI